MRKNEYRAEVIATLDAHLKVARDGHEKANRECREVAAALQALQGLEGEEAEARRERLDEDGKIAMNQSVTLDSVVDVLTQLRESIVAIDEKSPKRPATKRKKAGRAA